MSAETEIERLIVRLMGDGSDFQRMLQKAEQSLQQTAKQVEQATAKIEGFEKGITTYAKTAMSALAGIGAADFLKGTLNAYAAVEESQINLNNAIRMNGGLVDVRIAQYKRFADSMWETTNTSAGVTRGLLKEAEGMSITGQHAENVASNAIKVAAVTGQEAASYIRLTAALEKNDLVGLAHASHHINALRILHSPEQQRQKLLQMIAQGEKTLGERMDSVNGVMKHYEDTLSKIKLQFGKLIAEALMPAVKWFTQLIAPLFKLDEASKRVIVGAGILVAAITSVGPALALLSFAAPYLKLLGAGFGFVYQALLLLLNPLRLVSMLFTGLVGAAAFVFSPIGLVVAGATVFITLLVDKLGGMKKTWEMVRDSALNAWERIKQGAAVAWQYIQKKAEQFWDWIKPVVDWFVGAFAQAWKLVQDIAAPMWESLKQGASELWTKLKDLEESAVGWAAKFIKANGAVLFNLGAVAAAVAGAYGAYRVLWSTVGMVTSVLALLKVEQIASAVAWGVSTAAVMLWHIAVTAAYGIATVIGPVLGFITGMQITLNTVWYVGVAAITAWGISIGLATAVAGGLKIAAVVLGVAMDLLEVKWIASKVAVLAWNFVVYECQILMMDIRATMVFFSAVLEVLKLKWVLTTVAVFAWNVAMTVVEATTFLVNASWIVMGGILSLINANTLLHIVAMVSWTAAIILGKAAVWLFNAAMMVLNFLLGEGLVIGAVVAFAALATVMVVVTAAVMAAWEAGKALYNALAEIPTTEGAIKQIGELFGEWIEIIKKVVEAAKTDLPLAWEILKAGAMLAITQVKGYWPSLWELIKAGFAVAWIVVKDRFSEAFIEAIDQIKVWLSALWEWIVEKAFNIGERMKKLLDPTDIDEESIGHARHPTEPGQGMELPPEIQAKLREAQQRAEALQKAKDTLADIFKGGLVMDPSAKEEIDKQRKILDDLFAKIKPPEVPAPKLDDKAKDTATAAGKDVGQAFRKGLIKEMEKIDAVAWRSADRLFKVTSYFDKLNQQRIQQGGAIDPGVKMAQAQAGIAQNKFFPGGGVAGVDRFGLPNKLTDKELQQQFVNKGGAAGDFDLQVARFNQNQDRKQAWADMQAGKAGAGAGAVQANQAAPVWQAQARPEDTQQQMVQYLKQILDQEKMIAVNTKKGPNDAVKPAGLG